MEVYDDPEIINVGTGEDLTITKLAETISSVVGFQGALLLRRLQAGWNAA